MKRDTKRKEGRTATRGAALMAAFMVATVMLMTGCQSATPSATSNDSDIRDSQVVINNTVNIYPSIPGLTNATNIAALPYIPAMTFTISDVMGTQSTSSEGGSNSQDMTPTMTPGVTGDKPIEEIGSTVRSGLSAGSTTAVEAVTTTVNKATQ